VCAGAAALRCGLTRHDTHVPCSGASTSSIVFSSRSCWATTTRWPPFPPNGAQILEG
jgi:hypothetical protein